ncbi:hypothetical protein Sru01_28000 [Sphaerisporangium rufum]|uniref:CMP/dCMP-type deaminase domain-containing protein n=1 Tax=Sphaerisporangium rufum TaxID=1381558 RepID=A0A919V1G1_9ACTN|nr:deaminase [Sphaerisporangium rufum]GII77818.1 hypothetical protein Sru01_28000 [Sphaerisporangium rufum]
MTGPRAGGSPETPETPETPQAPEFRDIPEIRQNPASRQSRDIPGDRDIPERRDLRGDHDIPEDRDLRGDHDIPEDRDLLEAREDPAVPGVPGDPAADRRYLAEAVALARRCPVSTTAYAVGALIVTAGGQVLATGHSRESDPREHAEEAALAKITPADPRLATATIYTSLEPCTTRASRPRGCARLIIDAGLRRVVLAWREPDLFADCTGAESLRAAGVEVVELPELAAPARAANAHLFPG